MLDSDTAVPRPYNLNKVFHNGDRVVHHYEGVSYSLALSSSRIYNYESINHENMDGRYLSDGMLTAYAGDFSAYSDGWPQSNPYRRPGTTADTRERAVIPISQANESLSSQDFVGGVSDGICGTASRILLWFGSFFIVFEQTYFEIILFTIPIFYGILYSYKYAFF